MAACFRVSIFGACKLDIITTCVGILCQGIGPQGEKKRSNIIDQSSVSGDSLLQQEIDQNEECSSSTQLMTQALLSEHCEAREPKPSAQYKTAVRPDHGKAGIPIELISNFHSLECSGGNIYHYDIDIVSAKEKVKLEKSYKPYLMAKGSAKFQETKEDDKPRFKIGKQKCRKILHAMINENKYFKKFKPVYDGKKNLYTRRPLPIKDEIQFEVNAPENGKVERFIVILKPVVKESSENIISLKPLQDFFSGSTKVLPEEIRMVFDAILRHRDPPFHQISVGRSFFHLTEDHYSLGDGCEVWLGYNQGVYFTEKGPALVVNVAASAFHKSGPVIGYISEILNMRIDSNTDFYHLPQGQIEKLENNLSLLSVVTEHLGYKRKNKVRGLSKSARDERFYIIDVNKTVEKTVEQYYHDRYKITLKYPLIPCLLVGSAQSRVCIPPELCVIPPGQRILGKLYGNLTEKMIRKTVMPPLDKFERVQKGILDIKQASLPYLEEFGLRQCVNPVELTGRVLPKPDIGYTTKDRAQTHTTPNDKGAWHIQNCNYLKPAVFNNWMIISFAKPNFKSLENLGRCICESGKDAGLNLPKPIDIKTAWHKGTDTVFAEIVSMGESVSFVVVVFSQSDKKHSYAEIKYMGDIKYNLITVCVTDDVVERKLNRQITSNLCLKINRKLGGINHRLREITGVLDKPTIIFGADVVHSPGILNQPSIAALVGSLDRHFTNYSASCCKLVNPKSGKQTQEIILDLKVMVRKGLQAFIRANNECKPKRIIFYRDGVSEGQRQQVLDQEVVMVKAACKEIQIDYDPPLTFIIVKKRHQVRFRPKYSKKSTQNIPPGTVVDAVVTHPNNFDYYLCSHASSIGTSRPAHYDVLYDENRFSSDGIEKLSFDLCHVYSRCNKIISIPVPIKYADLLAYRAKTYIDWLLQLGNCFKISDIDDLLNRIETVKSRMFYV